MDLVLLRDDQNELRTFGTLSTTEGFRICETLELPWKDNQHGVSCIPEGEYAVKLQWSPARKRRVYWLQNVPGREAVQIHTGNFTSDIRGCILLGNKRAENALLESKLAYERFMGIMDGKDFMLKIEKAPEKEAV